MANVLVTGGAGFVGSSTVGVLLEAGHRVCVVDRLLHHGQALLPFWSHGEFRFLKGDIRDPAVIGRALDGCDAVIHLAAIVGDPACARDPDLARSTNYDASVALLEAARRAGVERFIFASTCSNYGKMSDPDQYVDEDSPLAPVSLYAETKVAFEKRLLDPQHSGDMITTALRFATVYGVSPRMRFDLTVNEFTMLLMVKRYLEVYGEQFWRPYIHVGDMARAARLVLEAPAGKVRRAVFNVGDTEENYQKQTIVELIQQQVPGAQVKYVRKQEDPRDYRVSFQKIKDQLDFQITRRVPDGIREIVQLIADGVITDFEDPKYRN